MFAMGEDVDGDDKERGAVRSSFITLIEHQHQETIHMLQLLDDKLELLRRPLKSYGFNSGVESLNILDMSSPSPDDPQTAAISSMQLASEGSRNSVAPQLLKSYTTFDNQLREDAEEAHADLEKKRIDIADSEMPGEKPSWAKQLSSSPYFDAFFAAVVLLNAIYIGIEVEVEIRNPNQVYAAMAVLQTGFTVLFAIELIVRLCAGGLRIFWGEDYMWCLLDLFIVLTSTWEIMMVLLQGELAAGPMGVTSLKALRIIRLTRVFKTAQVMRIFRFVIPLRTLVRSIMHTLKALIWALLLLFLVVYVFAVLFTQTVNTAVSDMDTSSPELHDVKRYFGNLVNTMLSLFMSIAGGVSWEAVITPLGFISPLWALLFLFYISFTYFAVLNVVTGVFCQSAIESAQNDHLTVAQSLIDNREAHIERLRTLFEELGTDCGITFHAFEEKMADPAVREYFETLGINVYDAWSFFKLLDADGGGCVEAEEFFEGCLRFRGQARAVEVGKVLQDQQWLIRSQSKFQSFVEEELNSLQLRFSGLVDLISATSTSMSRIHGTDDGTHARTREL